MYGPPSRCVWRIRFAWEQLLDRYRALWRSREDCRRSTLLLVGSVVWLVAFDLVSWARPTLVRRPFRSFCWGMNFGPDI